LTDTPPSDWKLKLRYGQLTTNFIHVTLIGDGKVITVNEEYNTELGPAVMALKAWVESHDEAFNMIAAIAEHLGFELKGRIELFETEPDDPPKEKQFGYAINFTAYRDEPKVS